DTYDSLTILNKSENPRQTIWQPKETSSQRARASNVAIALTTSANENVSAVGSRNPTDDVMLKPATAMHASRPRFKIHKRNLRTKISAKTEDCQINFDVHYGLDTTVSGPDDVCLNRDSASSEQDSSAGVAMVQSKRDPLIPAHYFKAPEHDHRFQYDNLREQHRQWRKVARKTPEYKEKQKQKKKAAIQKKLNAESH
ncbi:unnamed protein product, partial [Allacma fusca]